MQSRRPGAVGAIGFTRGGCRAGRPTPNSRWVDQQTARQVVDYAVAGNKPGGCYVSTAYPV